MLCIFIVKKSGDVLSASCTCFTGKGEACSHIAALMFYLEDFMRQGHSDLPTDTAATDHLQQWHVPPKHDVSVQPVEGITFRKAEYGKVVCTSLGHRYCPYPSDNKSNHDHAAANQCCMCCFAKQWTDPLLGHCRAIFSCHANVIQ